MKFKNWLIKKLGGHTKAEVGGYIKWSKSMIRQLEPSDQYVIANGHDVIKDVLGKDIVVIDDPVLIVNCLNCYIEKAPWVKHLHVTSCANSYVEPEALLKEN